MLTLRSKNAADQSRRTVLELLLDGLQYVVAAAGDTLYGFVLLSPFFISQQSTKFCHDTRASYPERLRMLVCT